MMTNRWLQWLNTIGTVAGLIVVFAFFALQSDSFATSGTLETIARQTAIVGIAAMGMTLIIIAGGIDLSVGSVVALVTVVIALTLERGWHPWLSATAGIAANSSPANISAAPNLYRIAQPPLEETMGTVRLR